MNNILDPFFKSLAKPFVFIAQKAALSIVLALLTGTLIYASYSHLYGTINQLLIKFLTDEVLWLQRAIFFFLPLILYFLLLNRTPLKVLNHPAINLVCCTFLFVLLFVLNKIVAIAIAVIILLLLLWKGYRGVEIDYDFTFNPYGDARWASYFHLFQAKLVEKAIDDKGFSFTLGRTIHAYSSKSNELIKFQGEGHILTVAKTGAGKGVSVVIPNLLAYKGSAVVVDPKGENFLKTHYHRELGFGTENHQILLVDPFKEVSKQITREINRISALDIETLSRSDADYLIYLQNIQASCSEYNGVGYLRGFNPMQIINELYDAQNYDEIYDEASVLADMLVVRTGNETDPHWNEKAKSFIKGAVLFVVFSEFYADEPKNLVTVRHCIFYFFKPPVKVKKSAEDFAFIGEGIDADNLSEIEDNFSEFLDECNDTSKFYHKYLKGVAGEVSLIAGDERNSVLSNVLRHTEFLDSPMVAQSITRNDCQINDIKRAYKTVYLVLPANKLSAYNRLSRLWINCILQSVARDLEVSQNRVLFMLDEMAQLGYMEPLIQAVSLMRGYGMNMWMIFQDLPQIKSIYGEKWQTFIANSRIQQYFGVTDNDTTEYVSKLLGQTTMTLRSDTDSSGNSRSNSGGTRSTNRSQTVSSAGKPLLYPDQVRRLQDQIIIADSIYPIRAARLNYYDDPLFSTIRRFPVEIKV